MRNFQLCLMTLAVCTQTHGEVSDWQGCSTGSTSEAWYFPVGSEIQCRNDTGCKLTCEDGHQLSNGAAHLDVKCYDVSDSKLRQTKQRQWEYSPWLEGETPTCEAGQRVVCSPSCQNGHKCSYQGVCQCTVGFEGAACEISSCDIESVFDGEHSCSSRNGKYICHLHCSSQGEVEVTHICDYSTGIWSPSLSKCYPGASKCDIKTVDFDGGYRCAFSNIGYISCELKCPHNKDAVTHICDHSTGIWSPSINRCSKYFERCKNGLAGHDGGYKCYYGNSEYICYLYCIEGEDSIIHTCSPGTGVWSPPIRKCKPEGVLDL